MSVTMLSCCDGCTYYVRSWSDLLENSGFNQSTITFIYTSILPKNKIKDDLLL